MILKLPHPSAHVTRYLRPLRSCAVRPLPSCSTLGQTQTSSHGDAPAAAAAAETPSTSRQRRSIHRQRRLCALDLCRQLVQHSPGSSTALDDDTRQWASRSSSIRIDDKEEVRSLDAPYSAGASQGKADGLTGWINSRKRRAGLGPVRGKPHANLPAVASKAGGCRCVSECRIRRRSGAGVCRYSFSSVGSETLLGATVPE